MACHKEEVVISGIGGLFPECDNLDELKDFLFSKCNGVTIDWRRWSPSEQCGTHGTGKLKNIDKFDATFFSTHPKLAENMDPLTRICLESSVKAIIDAGLSPSDLYETNTAVLMGSTISATEMHTLDCSQNAAFSMLGRSKSMQANRVSYILNLTGPSFTMDGGWICGSNGLEKAKSMIENGIISSAIVGVTSLVLRPEIQYQFQGLNRLNHGVCTKSFSNDADGYNRSEGSVVMLLQKASVAKRSYGSLLGVKSVQFGNHQDHVTEHIGDHFKSLLIDSYKEVNIDPSTVEYIEAYGCGIKNEDSMELNVMEEVFCTDKRQTPLKVGSVKSNLGHCEVSGLFISIVKAIIALDSGYIPPNINYTEPNENVAALKSGKIQVITEKTLLVSDIIGISSFGFLNSFSHVILKRNHKVKKNFNESKDDGYIQRLILASGRNEINVRATLNKIKNHGYDDEFIALTNAVFTKNINAHFYRGFSIYPKLDELQMDDVWNVNLRKRPVWFIFSGMGSQWQGMGLHLMKLPIFAEAINRCDVILRSRGVNIKHILTSQDPHLFDNILHSFVGIAAVQIGLVEVLKALGITPDGMIGHSVGELGCAYADGCFTAEEMLLSAHARGRASLETKLIPGMMAAVGLGYNEIKNQIPNDVDVACRNSTSSCTISGPTDSINAFVSQLKSEGVFAKTVNVSGIAFHSRYIQSAGPTLHKYLKEVIKEPKIRSSKWISTSLPQSDWNSDLAKYSSSEYHTNNLLNSVLFEDSLKHIPVDAITIEIAPHGLLQAIIKTALPTTVTNISLTKRVFGDSIQFLLTAVGKMYLSGLNPKIQELYPPIDFPVSRGTPSIENLPFWDHNEQWKSTINQSNLIHGICGEKVITLLLNDNIHLTEYQIHKRHIIPLSYILVNVWQMFVEMNTEMFSEESIQFNNLRFLNNVEIHPTNSSEACLMIQRGSGLFEYITDDKIVLSGQISFLQKSNLATESEKLVTTNKSIDDFQEDIILKDEVYEILENNGYKLGDSFKNITSYKVYENNIQGFVKWKNDWIYFLEGLIKFSSLNDLDTIHTKAPVSIRQISVNPMVFKNINEKDVRINYNQLTKEVTCNGVKIVNMKNGPLVLSEHKTTIVKLEEETFIQFDNLRCEDFNEFISTSMDIIMEADTLHFYASNLKLILCTLHHYDDLVSRECIKSIKRILENQISINSMMLIWDNVKNSSAYDKTGIFITVTNFCYLQETIKSLFNKKCSYIVTCSKHKLENLKDWKIIIQQKFNNDTYLTLIKKDVCFVENSLFIKQSIENYDLSVRLELEKCNLTNELIFLIIKTEPLEGISFHVKEILTKYKTQRLRFLFILDSNALEFETNKLFYINQLSKGMIVNIYKNGAWGSYKRLCLCDLKDSVTIATNPLLHKVSTIYKNELKPLYLGLNFKNLVVEDNTKNEFGPLEYSGLVENNNKTVMGITSLTKISSEEKYDDILSWPVPLTWTLENAATVPLTYALSYYILRVLCFFKSDNSILITSGLHPVGQAAISISLAEKCQTFAIVESIQQADLLSSLFPELSRSRILVNVNNKFDTKIKMMSNSKGIDFILNFLCGDAFHAAFRSLADHGKFFNFSKSDMKNHENIGTRIFLRNTSFFVISPNMLLRESDRVKENVRQAFMDGLNKGVVKPFNKCVLTMPFNISSILDAMRATSIASRKVILPMSNFTGNSSEDFEHDSYQCHSDHVYIVTGNKSGWLDLSEWLVDRGAQKIVISVKQCLMSSAKCRRLNKLITQNVSIQIESDLYLKSKEESLNWLNRITSLNVLGSIFIVNQLNENKINNMRYAYEGYSNKKVASSFVCISSKGKNICDRLKSMGFNAINLFWNGMSTKPKDMKQLLVSLDTLLHKSITTTSSSFVCSEQGINKWEWSQHTDDVIVNFFPDSVDELYLLNDKIVNEAKFVEVQTKSPRFSQLKSVLPIFVVPGFKPKLIETLYANLLYPAFEAQLPSDVHSIDRLSEDLVNKLKSISNQGYVSLIGESWGGIVALKMAQMLEAQGTLVTVSLLEGDPEILTGWAKCFLSNDNLTNKLNTIYTSFPAEAIKHSCFDGTKLLQVFSNSKTERIINVLRFRLQALSETKPLLNKLLTNIIIFRYKRTSDFDRINLNDYCINQPIVHVISKTDYRMMMMDKDMITTVNNNAALLYPVGIELSMSEKYKHFYFYTEKTLSI